MRWGVTFEAFMGDLMMNWNSMMDRNLQKVEDIDMSIIISLFSKTCIFFIPDAFATGYPKYVVVALLL